MDIKLKILTVSLIGCISVANAYEIGDEIPNSYYTKLSDNIAISSNGVNNSPYYAIDIYAVSTNSPKNYKNIGNTLTHPTTVVEKKLWTITLNQLPITEGDCLKRISDICLGIESNCYSYCLASPVPKFVAFDDKNKRLYLNYPTKSIGVTGIGPSFLFVADINKKEIKFLDTIGWEETGKLSPSNRYLVLYGLSVIHLYDIDKNSWFDINQSENDYIEKNIVHNLDLIRWISDKQFTYLDRAKYFIGNGAPQPFISAKEITYDITTKTRLSEKNITEKEYNELVKGDTESH